MSEQFKLDLQPREEKPDFNSQTDAELRKLFVKELGPPVPFLRKDIIEALTNPTAYLAKKEAAINEDKSDLKRIYTS